MAACALFPVALSPGALYGLPNGPDAKSRTACPMSGCLVLTKLGWEHPPNAPWNFGGRRTMWRMSNAQAVIFVTLIVIAVAMIQTLLA